MRRLIVVAVLVVVLAVSYRSLGSAETGTGSLTLPQPSPNVGESVPPFNVPSEEGGMFELPDEGAYVLAFFSTYNGQSNQARVGFEDLAEEYSDDGIEFAVVYVNSAPNDESIAYEVLQDRTGQLTSDYNVKRVPRLFLIEDGSVRLVQNGYYPENEEQLAEEIQALLESRGN
ncbi:MAG: peroxiredoxin family protein [Actinomycetota bacterium]|nr:redoxin domain-containing protein [Rubrobacter sp.]MDQ3509363.1 peroxiredoxin family protein [Actinomycetota bacterium]